MKRVYVTGLFLLSRLFILGVGAVYLRLAGLQESVGDAFCKWDCNWYLGLAATGYDLAPHAHPAGDAANWAFFPLYPLLFSTVSQTGLSLQAAGYLVSNACFLIALHFFYDYCEKSLGKSAAGFATLLLAVSPYSVYFVTIYTESLFLMLSVLVFYFAGRERWIFAGMAAALLTATRSVGILIVPVLAWMVIQRYGWRETIALRGPASSGVLAVAAAPLGLALFMIHLHGRMGDALAFSHIQVAWGRELANPLRVLMDGILSLRPGPTAYAAVTTSGLAASAVLFFHKRKAEAIFMAGAILLPLSTALYGMPRYLTALFPAYISASLLLQRHPLLRRSALFLCIGLNVILVVAWLQKRKFMV